ncbi:MAG: ATP-binding cassette domain-containing protein, partial [Alistipes sp.]|nr:ATP-binding cassette domain-containing protein [Alistipes sp.]
RLSGGERKRLYLCTVLMRSPNFLVLDEPTNDLDIVTLGVLEEYLRAFRGCVLVVSHDRFFVDRVADHLLVFCGEGEVREFAGSYSDYLDWRRGREAARQEAASRERVAAPAQQAPVRTDSVRKLTFKEKRELEELELQIPELEREKASLEERLSSGELPFEELQHASERIAELIGRIDACSMRWLELSEIGG